MDWFLTALFGVASAGSAQWLLEEVLRLTQLALESLRAADQILGPTFRFLGVLVAFFSGVVAIYLKFNYAESRLHLRFQEFLEREENRLAFANRKLDETVKRPGPAHNVQSPIFIAPDLRPHLREMELGGLTLRSPFQGRMRRAEQSLG